MIEMIWTWKSRERECFMGRRRRRRRRSSKAVELLVLVNTIDENRGDLGVVVLSFLPLPFFLV